MDLEILQFIDVSADLIGQVESVIAVLGDPDCIMAFHDEVELSWYRTSPDRMLEISIYGDENLPLWYEKTVFHEDLDEEVETGEVETLMDLSRWLEGEALEY